MWGWIVVIVLAVAFAGGAVGMFFFLRNNPEYLNVDKLLKAMKKEKLAELKAKAEELLK